MPCYDYICSNQHRASFYRSISDRARGEECPECGEMLEMTFQGTEKKAPQKEEKKKIKVTYRNGKPKTVLHLESYKCNACEDEGVANCCDADLCYDKSSGRCEKCGSAELTYIEEQKIHGIDRFSERFPYFDRGLGVMLTSKNHRRSAMKQKGVSEVGGDFSVRETSRNAREAEAADNAVLGEMQDKFQNHPGYREFRRLKERGWSPNYKHRKQRLNHQCKAEHLQQVLQQVLQERLLHRT